MAVLFGIDVGGSGVKGAPVDVERGQLVAERHRIKTPRPATPGAVLDVATELAAHFDWSGPIGLALPAVVRNGVVRTAANIAPEWIGVDAASLLAERTGCPVAALNDADAAGIAEVRHGAAAGEPGVVLLLTFGTGIGSAVFADGVLLPNTELGHLEFRGGPAEHYAAARLVEEEDMDLHRWASRVSEYLHHLERLLSPDVIVVGGGISKRFDAFAAGIETEAKLVAARLRNNAGIVGAAVAAHEAVGRSKE